MKNKRKIIARYIISDIFAAIFTWIIFFVFRKVHGESLTLGQVFENIMSDPKFFLGLVLYPSVWLFIYAVTGAYHKVFQKSRLKELSDTFLISLLGCLGFFFLFILDDIIINYTDYIVYFLTLFLWQFLLTYIPRVSITTLMIHQIKSGKILLNSLLIGSGERALMAFQTIDTATAITDYHLVGYLKTSASSEDYLKDYLPCLGDISDLSERVCSYEIVELIIALQEDESYLMEDIFTDVMDREIGLKVLPQPEDYFLFTRKVSSVLPEPFIFISTDTLPLWQKHTKRVLDIVLSVLALIVLSPVYLFLAIGVKCSSQGPIFYIQERIGYKCKPFKIIKFRSMIQNAEQSVPQLSSQDDPRITRFGKFMRKTRLDEIPQFFNVLIGDMSLVGYRPERQYYIDQIMQKAPYYKLLFRIRPGITSWGQVKFGYAENVDEMIKRLRWDILYIENMSLSMDIKILIHTILIVIKRAGK